MDIRRHFKNAAIPEKKQYFNAIRKMILDYIILYYKVKNQV
jgi:hypothetical protein